MVSDNVLLAQSLFALLLASERPRAPFVPSIRAGNADDRAPLVAADGARLLRSDPLLARATASQLLALAAIAPEVTLRTGSVLFDVAIPPAIYVVLQGQVILEYDGHPPLTASAGSTIGVADTLAGATSWRATVFGDGRALRIDRDDLFAILADHVDLMQGLFSGALAMREMPGVVRPEPVDTGGQPASLA
jgi:hypothetical protein